MAYRTPPPVPRGPAARRVRRGRGRRPGRPVRSRRPATAAAGAGLRPPRGDRLRPAADRPALLVGRHRRMPSTAPGWSCRRRGGRDQHRAHLAGAVGYRGRRLAPPSRGTWCSSPGGRHGRLPGPCWVVTRPHPMIEAYATGYPVRYSQFGTASSPPGDRTRSGSPTRPRTRGVVTGRAVLPATRSSSCRRSPSACCWQPVTARSAPCTPLLRHPRGPGPPTSSSPTAWPPRATAGPAARRRAWTSCGPRKAGSAPTPPTRTSDARGIPQNINGWSAELPAGQRRPADRLGPVLHRRPVRQPVRRLGL